MSTEAHITPTTLKLASLGALGSELISMERKRQIAHHRYNSNIDDTYLRGDLAAAAVFYAIPQDHELAALARSFWPDSWSPPAYSEDDQKMRGDHPDQFRIQDLIKAGALIAAEIDRLARRLGRKEGLA